MPDSLDKWMDAEYGVASSDNAEGDSLDRWMSKEYGPKEKSFLPQEAINYAKASGSFAQDVGDFVGRKVHKGLGSSIKDAGKLAEDYWTRREDPLYAAEVNKPIYEETPDGESRLNVPSVRGLVGKVIQSAPPMVTTMATPLVLARTGAALTKARKVAADALGWGVGEGAMAGMQTGRQAAEQVMNAKPEEIEKAPEYLQLRSGGMSDVDARNELANRAYNTAGGGAAVTTGLWGGLAGPTIGKLFRGEGGNILSRMGKGALAEGGTEAPQSALEQGWQNLAEQRTINPSKNLTDGMLSAGIEGGVVGSVMGGGTGAVSPSVPRGVPLDTTTNQEPEGEKLDVSGPDGATGVYSDEKKARAKQIYEENIRFGADEATARKVAWDYLQSKYPGEVSAPSSPPAGSGRGVETSGSTPSPAPSAPTGKLGKAAEVADTIIRNADNALAATRAAEAERAKTNADIERSIANMGAAPSTPAGENVIRQDPATGELVDMETGEVITEDGGKKARKPKVQKPVNLSIDNLHRVGNVEFTTESAAIDSLKDLTFQGYKADDFGVSQLKNGKWIVYPKKQALDQAPRDFSYLDQTYPNKTAAYNAAKVGLGLNKGEYEFTKTGDGVRVTLTESGKTKLESRKNNPEKPDSSPLFNPPVESPAAAPDKGAGTPASIAGESSTAHPALENAQTQPIAPGTVSQTGPNTTGRISAVPQVFPHRLSAIRHRDALLKQGVAKDLIEMEKSADGQWEVIPKLDEDQISQIHEEVYESPKVAILARKQAAVGAGAPVTSMAIVAIPSGGYSLRVKGFESVPPKQRELPAGRPRRALPPHQDTPALPVQYAPTAPGTSLRKVPAGASKPMTNNILKGEANNERERIADRGQIAEGRIPVKQSGVESVEGVPQNEAKTETVKQPESLTEDIAVQKPAISREIPTSVPPLEKATHKGAFKKGDRVVLKDGRHGVVTEATGITMRPLIIGKGGIASKAEDTSWYYTVKTDNGVERLSRPDEMEMETNRPSSVIPDIQIPGDIFREPGEILRMIGNLIQEAKNARAAAGRARKSDKIRNLIRHAKEKEARADLIQSIYNDWAAKYPEEATKHGKPEKPSPSPSATVAKEDHPIPSGPAQSSGKAPLFAEDLSEKAVIVKGDTRTHKERIKAAGGMWNGRAGGWMFPKSRWNTARPKLADLLETSSTPATNQAIENNIEKNPPSPLDKSAQVIDIISDEADNQETSYEKLRGIGNAGGRVLGGEPANLVQTPETNRQVERGAGESRQDDGTGVGREYQAEAGAGTPAERSGAGGSPHEDDRTGSLGSGAGDVHLPASGGRPGRREDGSGGRGTRGALAPEPDRRMDREVEDVQAGGVRDKGGLSGRGGVREGIGGGVAERVGRGVAHQAGADEKKAGEGEARSHVTPPPSGENYRITDTDRIGEGGVKQKFRDNIRAIEALKRIEAENRSATGEEQALLVRYVGWGGMPQAFDPYNKSWKEEYQELSALLTEEEYDAARASTLNAHYTSPEVIKRVWNAVRRLGFNSGRALEPAAGIGHFIGMTPEDISGKTFFTGVELDSVTGRIAKLLYPQSRIEVSGFENVKTPDNFFDLAISNVPFGDYRIIDSKYPRRYSIHDYFFVRALDAVRPGGLVAFITSRYTMDKVDVNIRKILAAKADLIGAIRLPDTAFKANAGTEVVTDIIFLQKREQDAPTLAGQDWLTLKEVQTSDGRYASINKYFAAHPEMMLGKLTFSGSMYGGNQLNLEGDGRDLGEALDKAVARLPENVFKQRARPETVSTNLDTFSLPAPDDIHENAFYMGADGKMYQKVEGKGSLLREQKGDIFSRRKGMIEVRSILREVYRTQLNEESEKAQESARKKLNKAYDAFVKSHGPIHSKSNRLAFLRDPDYFWLRATEKNYNKKTGTAEKTDVFSKRTVFRQEPVSRVDSAKDALVASLNELGKVDLSHMARIYGKPEADVIEELGDRIYRDPQSKEWIDAEEYLSGEVKEKLAYAEIAARHEPEYRRNVKALKAVQPKDLLPSEIDAQLGQGWIPEADIQDFITQTLELRDDAVEVSYVRRTGKWMLAPIKGRYDSSSPLLTSKYGLPERDALEILDDIFSYKPSQVTRSEGRDDNGNETRRVDEEKTALAEEKQALLKERFSQWLWENPERAERIAQIYNDKFNTSVPRKYDGSHLTLPGASKEIQLRAHQKDAIWRIMRSGNTGLYHAVGAGKTFTQIAAAMELKRIGVSRKPLQIVPNNILDQFVTEAYQLYPMARIMRVSKEDLSDKNRRRSILGRIANDNWDLVVLTQSSFGKIGMSPAFTKQAYEEMIQQIEIEKIESQEEAEGHSRRRSNRGGAAQYESVKELEKLKKKIQDKVSKIKESAEAGKDKSFSLSFEELGVDQLFIDEAHLYKNLQIITRMQNISGLATSSSNRAEDMLLKTQYMGKIKKGRGGVVFATGTPITNTMAEIYNMMRYLSPDVLKKQGLESFDAWARQYAEAVVSFELAPVGNKYRMTRRFKSFMNIPELMAQFRETADIKTAETLKLPVPEIEGGKATVVIGEASAELDRINLWLMERAEAVRSKRVEPEEDNMLKITNDGRKAGLDVRLIDPSFADDPNSKVNKAVLNIFGIWKSTRKDNLTQMVFIDLSTPKNKRKVKLDKAYAEAGDETETENDAETPAEADLSQDDALAAQSKFSVYEDMRDKLIRMGVPEDDIAFIHDYEKDVEKSQLFDSMNEGRVRILFGSTQKMGAGTNAQRRLVAMHHMDAPWRPADLEQRNGRILRQGNINKSVKIFQYGTDKSFDAYIWQLLENKAGFIAQIMNAKEGVRRADDVGGDSLSYAEMKAAISGNPIYFEKAKIDREVKRLMSLRRAHNDQQMTMVRNLRYEEGSLEPLMDRVDHAEKLAEKINDALGKYEKSSDIPFVMGDGRFDRKDANAKIWKLITNSTLTDETIGSYLGVPVALKVDRTGDIGYSLLHKTNIRSAYFYIHSNAAGGETYRAVLEGPEITKIMDSPDAVNFVQRIHNMMTGVEGSRIPFLKESLSRSQKRIEALRKEKDKPWEKAAELETLLTRQTEINAEIKKIADAEKEKKGGESDIRESRVEERMLGWASPMDKSLWRFSTEDVKDAARRFRFMFSKLNSSIKVVDSMADLPADVKRRISADRGAGSIAGLYDKRTGTAYLVTDGLNQKAVVAGRTTDAEFARVVHETIKHEIFGHGLFRDALGDKWLQLKDDIFEKWVKIPALAKELKRIQHLYDEDVTTAKGRDVVAEEIIASMAEQEPESHFIKRIVAKIRQFLRELGISLHFTHDDVIEILRGLKEKAGREGAMSGVGGAEDILYSRSKNGDIRVNTPQRIFDILGIKPAPVVANSHRLFKKHPEAFTSQADVAPHIEYVLAAPTHKFPGLTDNVRLLVRRNGKDKAVAIEVEKEAGKYRIKSAYILTPGQLEIKMKKVDQSGGRDHLSAGQEMPHGVISTAGAGRSHDPASPESPSSSSNIPPSTDKGNDDESVRESRVDEIYSLKTEREFSLKTGNFPSEKTQHADITGKDKSDFSTNAGGELSLTGENSLRESRVDAQPSEPVTPETSNLTVMDWLRALWRGMKPVEKWAVTATDIITGKSSRHVVTGDIKKAEAFRKNLEREGNDVSGPVPAGKVGALSQFFLSPEYFDDDSFREGIRISLDRKDNAHRMFNDFDSTADGRTVSQLLSALKKGASSQYQTLIDVMEWADTQDWRKPNRDMTSQQFGEWKERKTLAELEKRGAGAEAIAAWRGLRKAYDKYLDALIGAAKDTGNLDMTIRDEDGRPITLREALAQMGDLRGSYAPRIRRGDWGVVSTDKDGIRHREHFEFKAQAEARKMALEKMGWKVGAVEEITPMSESVYGELEAAATGVAIREALKKAAAEGKLDENTFKFLNDGVMTAMSDLIKARGFRKHAITRGKGDVVQGYITDPMEAYIRYAQNNSAGMAKAKAARELYGILTKIDPKKEAYTYDAFSRFVAEQLRNADRWDMYVGAAKTAAAYKYLFANPKSAMINLTALITTAPAAIHHYAMDGKGNMGAIGPVLMRSGLDFVRFLNGKMGGLTPDEQALMNEVKRSNWDDPQQVLEITRELNGKLGGAWGEIMRYGMWPFTITEKMNRGTTILAAYRMARRSGKGHGEAMELARHATDRAHGIYDKATMPLWAQGTDVSKRIAQVGLTFSKFGHNYLQMLREIGVKNPKAFVYGITSPLLVAGGMAVPFHGAIVALANAIASALGDDRDQEKRLWDWIRSVAGAESERIARFGVAGQLGVDISGSLQPNFGGMFFPRDFYEVFGPLGGVAKDVVHGFERMSAGDVTGGALQMTAPVSIASAQKAVRETEGARTASGRPLWDEDMRQFMPTEGETALQSVGFNPARRSLLVKSGYEARRESGRFAETKAEIYDKYRILIQRGEPATGLLKEIQDYNRKAKKAGQPLITMESLASVRRGMTRPTKAQIRQAAMRGN